VSPLPPAINRISERKRPLMHAINTRSDTPWIGWITLLAYVAVCGLLWVSQ